MSTRGPSKDASYQVLIHLAKRFQRRRFFYTNGLWWPCLLTDRDKMTNLYRGPSIDASYQTSVHLGKWFQRRFFQKTTNQKQEWSVAVMFVNGSELNEQSSQRTFQGCFLPSFDSFGKAVSEEKIFFFKLTNQKQELPVVAMFVNGSGRNELSLQRICHR